MIQVRDLREQGHGQGHTCGKQWSWAGQSGLKQAWELGKRLKLIWGPWGQPRISGIQAGKVGVVDVGEA